MARQGIENSKQSWRYCRPFSILALALLLPAPCLRPWPQPLEPPPLPTPLVNALAAQEALAGADSKENNNPARVSPTSVAPGKTDDTTAKSPPQAAKPDPPKSEFRADAFFAATKPYLDASTPARDLEMLVREAIARGQNELVEILLTQSGPDSRNPRMGLWRAIQQLGLPRGEPQRALDQLPDASQVLAHERPLLELVRQLLRFRLAGREANIEDNPWAVAWIGPDGKYAPATLAPDEQAKLPSNILSTWASLVTWLPRHGGYWALLGELFNARGDIVSALDCLERAKTLQYYPKVLREHYRLLEQHKRQQEALVKQRLDALLAGSIPPTANAEDSANRGSENSNSATGTAATALQGTSTQVFFAMAIGIFLLGTLLALQWRVWFPPKRKGSS